MENKLALEILKTIQRGNSFGYQTVWDEVSKMQGLMELTNVKFKEVWDRLKDTNCIQSFRDEARGNTTAWRLNTERDCIGHYEAKIKEEELKANPPIDPVEIERKNLEMQQLRSNNQLLVEQLVELPKIRQQRNWLFIFAIIELIAIIAGLILQGKGK